MPRPCLALLINLPARSGPLSGTGTCIYGLGSGRRGGRGGGKLQWNDIHVLESSKRPANPGLRCRPSLAPPGPLTLTGSVDWELPQKLSQMRPRDEFRHQEVGENWGKETRERGRGRGEARGTTPEWEFRFVLPVKGGGEPGVSQVVRKRRDYRLDIMVPVSFFFSVILWGSQGEHACWDQA